MEELKAGIENVMQNQGCDFSDLAEKWSLHCLKTYRDELGKRGMELALALKKFNDELQGLG